MTGVNPDFVPRAEADALRKALAEAMGDRQRAIEQGIAIKLDYRERMDKVMDERDALRTICDGITRRAERAEAREAALRVALAAYRSAVRSGERESDLLREMGDVALAGTGPEYG